MDNEPLSWLSTDSVQKNTIIAENTGHIGKAFAWSDFFPFIFKSNVSSSSSDCKLCKYRISGWMTTVNTMRRLHECILGTSNMDMANSISNVWLLGTCYKALPEELSGGSNHDGMVNFLEDFSSRIWVTYRKGFQTIGNSKLTSDVGWGCMIRSSQMLVAQALLFHHLGRAWRKPLQKPYDPEYIKLLNRFGDSEECAFSIHSLLQAGRGCGLTVGSWVGPYAICRTWESLSHQEKGKENLPMAVYIVSDDENGERGGVPVICIDVAARLCFDFNNGEDAWAPILLLVPLVLGLEKVNPRYIPLLWDTFTFPQSLGILGGKPGASTYIVGVQDDKVLYLDPHDVQPVVEIKSDNLEADASSYHCNIVRDMPLEQIDPSLAIGFYCKNEDDFKNFCFHASELVEKSNGAPLFTVSQSLKPTKSIHVRCRGNDEIFEKGNMNDTGVEDWQLL